jgi:hypothetical protein
MSAPGGAICGAWRVDRTVAQDVINDILDAAQPGAHTLA